MKKLFILAITLTGLSTFLNAQNSFPTSNAMWNECIRVNNAKYENLYGLLGDTMINNIIYSRLCKFSDTILSEENIYGYIGALRSEDQKVWFKPAFWSYPDILLYDFGAKVGDTIWHNAVIQGSYSQGYYHYLIEPHSESYSIISSIVIESNRKKYQVTVSAFPYYNEWYESIGSIYGIFKSILIDTPLDGNSYGYSLLCFKHNDAVEYLNNPSCNKCFCPTANIENSYLESVNIYPIPATNILNIEIPEDAKIKSIRIYSMDGRHIEKSRYSFDAGQLNINSLKEGSYIVNIETDKGSLNKLIIKK